MEYVGFGRTGLRVTRLCLGTMTFGNQCDEDTSRQILNAAFDAGITFLDTANNYPIGAAERFGTTESIVGRWLEGRRDEIILASKCNRPTGRRPWEAGNSRKNILLSVEQSLRRLRTDYLDLYQVHAWDPATPIDETLGALDALVTSGKVRYAGCANFRPYQLARAIGRAELLGCARPESVQWRYNLVYREAEQDLFPLCAADGIAVLPYNPLAGGLLAGRHDRSAPTAGSRFTVGTSAAVYAARYWRADTLDFVDQLRLLAADAGVSAATLSIQWVLARPEVTSVLVGASAPGQIADAVRAVATPLASGPRLALDDLSSAFLPEPDVPWDTRAAAAPDRERIGTCTR
jgi:1-deoxyxylulose-5-phosphate synthase